MSGSFTPVHTLPCTTTALLFVGLGALYGTFDLEQQTGSVSPELNFGGVLPLLPLPVPSFTPHHPASRLFLLNNCRPECDVTRLRPGASYRRLHGSRTTVNHTFISTHSHFTVAFGFCRRPGRALRWLRPRAADRRLHDRVRFPRDPDRHERRGAGVRHMRYKPDSCERCEGLVHGGVAGGIPDRGAFLEWGRFMTGFAFPDILHRMATTNART